MDTFVRVMHGTANSSLDSAHCDSPCASPNYSCSHQTGNSGKNKTNWKSCQKNSWRVAILVLRSPLLQMWRGCSAVRCGARCIYAHRSEESTDKNCFLCGSIPFHSATSTPQYLIFFFHVRFCCIHFIKIICFLPIGNHNKTINVTQLHAAHQFR